MTGLEPKRTRRYFENVTEYGGITRDVSSIADLFSKRGQTVAAASKGHNTACIISICAYRFYLLT
jgi:hypothetical protein